MTDIKHPVEYTEGVRVILLVSRNKDGGEKNRRITRISHNSTQFASIINDFKKIKKEPDRIYASLVPRNVLKAARDFKHKIIDADYQGDPETFYKNISNHWVSSLMIDTSISKEDKLWMFDCDSEDDYLETKAQLLQYNVPIHYEYRTKNGFHVVVKPFDRSKLTFAVRELLHDNSLILWCY